MLKKYAFSILMLLICMYGIPSPASLKAQTPETIIIYSSPAWSPNGNAIVFGALPYGATSDIWRVEADGTDLVQLTNTEDQHEQMPKWSPNGEFIAFVALKTDTLEIEFDLWLMNEDGSNPINLTANVAGSVDTIYAWSPDSQMLAFTVNFFDFDILPLRSEIWVVRLDDFTVFQASPPSQNIAFFAPTWSADSQALAFASSSLISLSQDPTLEDGGIWVAEMVGGELGTVEKYFDYPSLGIIAWQANTQTFAAARVNRGYEIILIDLENQTIEEFTNDIRGSVFTPSWSADGRWLLFRVAAEGNARSDIWLMDTQTNNQLISLTDTAYNSAPAWSPDGSKIVFISNRGGHSDLWLMDVDGSNLSKLFNE